MEFLILSILLLQIVISHKGQWLTSDLKLPDSALYTKTIWLLLFAIFKSNPISHTDTNNTSSPKTNQSNNDNNNKSNNDQLPQGDNNNNCDNTGNGSNGGAGDDDDDDDDDKKRKANDSNQNDKNDDNDDDEEEDDEDEKKEETEDVKLNVNAPNFVPISSSITSQRLALNTIDEDEKEEKESNPIKCAGTIEISRDLTQNIIPLTIKENISNIYYFMDKSMALRANKRMLKNEDLVAINYDFHDKDTNEILYCIIKKQNPSKHRGFKWIMMNKLFTKKEMFNEFNICEKEVTSPTSTRHEFKFMQQMDYIHPIYDILQTQLIYSTFKRPQWHRIPVDNKTNNKQRKALYLTKKEFMNKIEYFSTNDRNMNIIPIMMLNSNKGYWIEHIYIIKIDENIHIGISMKYKPHRNRIMVTGIHLNKQFILNKHQLAAPNHDCHCLDDFESDIDDLKIGNIDEDKNRIKDLQKRHEMIKKENDKIKNENKRYKKKYLGFKQFVQQFTNQKIPSSKLMTEAKHALDNDDDDTSPALDNLGTTNPNISVAGIPSLSVPMTCLYPPVTSISRLGIQILSTTATLPYWSIYSMSSLSSTSSPTPSVATHYGLIPPPFNLPSNEPQDTMEPSAST